MINFNFIFLILILLILIIYLVLRLLNCSKSINKVNHHIQKYSQTKEDLKDKIFKQKQRNRICQNVTEPFTSLCSINDGPGYRDAFESDLPGVTDLTAFPCANSQSCQTNGLWCFL